MFGRLSLRTRLILGVIALTAIGLATADVVTYSSLRSFLIGRTDSALDTDHQVLEAPGPKRLPGGLAVEVRALDGTRIVETLTQVRFPWETASSPPQLPRTISVPQTARSGPDRVRYFTVSALDGHGRYRVRASIEPEAGQMLVIAAPLREVDGTLHRLLVVELLVTAAIIAALTALGLWVVRLGLRPLDAIAGTAAGIAAGDLSRRVEHADDRTEVGRLGLALNAMLAQIEAAFKEREASEQKLRRFVADASHELRTPLAAVRAYAELFSRGAATRPDDLARSMSGIGRESQRMSLLVDDLLLLARLDEGRPLERDIVRLDEVVSEAVETAQTVEPERPISAHVDDAVVIGDRHRLRQVIDNLLANVRAHTPADAAVEVSLRRTDSAAEIVVTDSGPGMEAEALPHVFERFYRADQSRARASGGVGLGLAIVAAVAEAHGGSAAASATPGHGAAFTIVLPLAAGAETPEPPSREAYVSRST